MAVANRERGELPFQSGDTTYVMKLTTNGICQMETQSGRTFGDVIAGMQRDSHTDMRLFLWAMLQHHHPDLTLNEVGDIVDGFGIVGGRLKQTIQELIDLNTRDLPTKKEGSGNPPEAQGGTGGSST